MSANLMKQMLDNLVKESCMVDLDDLFINAHSVNKMSKHFVANLIYSQTWYSRVCFHYQARVNIAPAM